MGGHRRKGTYTVASSIKGGFLEGVAGIVRGKQQNVPLQKYIYWEMEVTHKGRDNQKQRLRPTLVLQLLTFSQNFLKPQ